MDEYSAGDLEQYMYTVVQSALSEGGLGGLGLQAQGASVPDTVESESSEDDYQEDESEDVEEEEDDYDDHYARKRGRYDYDSPPRKRKKERGFKESAARRRVSGLAISERAVLRVAPEGGEGELEQRTRAQWKVLDHTVTRRRYRCKRRDCTHLPRTQQPCRHRYRCSCPDQCRHSFSTCGCPDPNQPCEHIFCVHNLDKDPGPAPPTQEERQQAVAARIAGARAQVAALRPLLALETYTEPYAAECVELDVWKAARYAAATVGKPIPDKPARLDADNPLELSKQKCWDVDPSSEKGDDNKMGRHANWMTLGRRQCAQLIPAEFVEAILEDMEVVDLTEDTPTDIQTGGEAEEGHNTDPATEGQTEETRLEEGQSVEGHLEAPSERAMSVETVSQEDQQKAQSETTMCLDDQLRAPSERAMSVEGQSQGDDLRVQSQSSTSQGDQQQPMSVEAVSQEDELKALPETAMPEGDQLKAQPDRTMSVEDLSQGDELKAQSEAATADEDQLKAHSESAMSVDTLTQEDQLVHICETVMSEETQPDETQSMDNLKPRSDTAQPEEGSSEVVSCDTGRPDTAQSEGSVHIPHTAPPPVPATCGWSIVRYLCDGVIVDTVTVTRRRPHCSRKECATARAWGAIDVCRHMYHCDCDDPRNPCKHIYRVHSLHGLPGPPPAPPVDPAEENGKVTARLEIAHGLLQNLQSLLTLSRPPALLAAGPAPPPPLLNLRQVADLEQSLWLVTAAAARALNAQVPNRPAPLEVSVESESDNE